MFATRLRCVSITPFDSAGRAAGERQHREVLGRVDRRPRAGSPPAGQVLEREHRRRRSRASAARSGSATITAAAPAASQLLGDLARP